MEDKKRMNLGEWLCSRYEVLDTDKQNFDNLWDEVLEVFLPRKSFVFEKNTIGEKKTKVVSSAGIQANETFANGLHTFLTNPTIQFFEYLTGKPELDQDVDVRRYMGQRTEITHQIINDTNFHSEIHECYLDLGAIGTDCLRMEEVDSDEILRFETRPIYESVINENEFGIVDEVGRTKSMTGDQILGLYGEKWFEDHFQGQQGMADDFKRKLLSQPHVKHDIIEYFIPRKILKNNSYDTEVKGDQDFALVTVFKEKRLVIKTQGYNENIYAVSRLLKSSHEKYGRSYGMKCLPDMLSLNELTKIMIQGGQLNVKPPIIVPDDGAFGGFKIFPGAYLYKRPGADDPKPFNPNSRHDIAIEMIERLEQNIKRGFQNDKLEFPDFQRATAEEVKSVKEQDLRLLSPMLSRQHNEKLVPLIRRVDAVAERRGAFDELKLPKKLEGQAMTIKYSSAIARVQKTQLADNASRWYAAMEAAAQTKPEVMDNVNTDNYAKYLAFGLSAPGVLLNTEEEKQEIRDERKAQQQQALEMQRRQMEAETIQKGADAAGKLGVASGEEQG